MESRRKRERVEFLTSSEKFEGKQNKNSFCGLEKWETNHGNPFFMFNYDKLWMTFQKNNLPNVYRFRNIRTAFVWTLLLYIRSIL